MATTETITPDRQHSPQKQAFTITEAQKQALIDNIQLEVTERARKLRAQYALQAQALRTRLEMRINRIPTSLRKTKMQDLVDKYAQQHNKPAPTSSLSSSTPHKHTTSSQNASPARTRGIKRTSDHLPIEDKENDQPALNGPKKRSKPNPTPQKSSIPPPTAIPTSPKTALHSPKTVLSPKSHNSRQFPIKSPPLSAFKYPSSRPATALGTHTTKLPTSLAAPTGIASPAKAPRPASRSAIKRPGTAPAAALLEERPRSSASDSSVNTTIVRKNIPAPPSATAKAAATRKPVPAPAPAPATAPAPVHTKRTGLKNALSSLTGSKKAKAAAAATKESAAPPPVSAGGRVLRKRGN